MGFASAVDQRHGCHPSWGGMRRARPAGRSLRCDNVAVPENGTGRGTSKTQSDETQDEVSR